MIVVAGAIHTQKDGVDGNGCSLKGGVEAFVLFLRGAQLVLRSSVFTVLDLDEVTVTFKNAEIFETYFCLGSGVERATLVQS